MRSRGDVDSHFPDKLLQSVIPRNVRLSESPSHGLSVIEYDSKSAGAEAYRSLALELVQQVGGAPPAPQAELSGEQARKSWNLRALFSRDSERARRSG